MELNKTSALQELNTRRVILYIKNTLESIEIGKTWDRIKPEILLIAKLKTIITDFLEAIKNRKGINGFKILSINIDFDKIFIDLDIYIDYLDYNSYNIIITIPYTSNNYGLK